jgi:hypothetical protein
VKIEPPEKKLVINTMRPAIPKKMPIMKRKELETAFTGVMLLIPHIKTTKPKRHRTIPTSMPLVSTLSTN